MDERDYIAMNKQSKESKMKDKAKFANKILLEYAKENGINGRDTTDLSPLETWLILRLFSVSGSLPSVDPLDDENSEIHKIGREIAEMSDEEFEANCKAIEEMLKGSKGNDR